MLKNKAQASRIKSRMDVLGWTILGLGWCGVASATLFAPQPFSKTVRATPVIVWGQVGMSYSEWSADPSGTKRIYTFYELQVFEVLKGRLTTPVTLPTTLMMREMGGEKDGVGMSIDGAAHFARGEEVVVFLSDPHSDHVFDVFGMALGKYSVSRNEAGEKILSGLGLFENGYDPNASEAQKKWTIEDLRNVIMQQDHSIEQRTGASQGGAVQRKPESESMHESMQMKRGSVKKLGNVSKETSRSTQDQGGAEVQKSGGIPSVATEDQFNKKDEKYWKRYGIGWLLMGLGIALLGWNGLSKRRKKSG